MAKCKQCGTSMGFLGKLKGVKPSEKDPELCNKCEANQASPEQPADQPQADQTQ